MGQTILKRAATQLSRQSGYRLPQLIPVACKLKSILKIHLHYTQTRSPRQSRIIAFAMTASTDFEEMRPKLKPASILDTKYRAGIRVYPPQRLLNYELCQICMNGAYYKNQSEFCDENCTRMTDFTFLALALGCRQASETRLTQFLLFSSLVVTVKAAKAQ